MLVAYIYVCQLIAFYKTEFPANDLQTNLQMISLTLFYVYSGC